MEAINKIRESLQKIQKHIEDNIDDEIQASKDMVKIAEMKIDIDRTGNSELFDAGSIAERIQKEVEEKIAKRRH